jgi:hypothetical protein
MFLYSNKSINQYYYNLILFHDHRLVTTTIFVNASIVWIHCLLGENKEPDGLS